MLFVTFVARVSHLRLCANFPIDRYFAHPDRPESENRMAYFTARMPADAIIGEIGAIILIVAAILFGGATRIDVLAPIIPRLVAIIVICLLLWQRKLQFSIWSRWEKFFWMVLLLVPLIQLIPLPFSWWSELPGRSYPRDLLSTIGTHPWLGISLTPDKTVNSLLALMPAFAAYALARQASETSIKRWFTILLGLAFVSALLGIFQVAGGNGSALRFYAITNSDSAVGLFSNANHHASFLAACMALLGYWTVEQLSSARDGSALRIVALSATIAMVFALAILMTFSRAGVAFLVVELVAALLFIRHQFDIPRKYVVATVVALGGLALGLWLWLHYHPEFVDPMLDQVVDNGRIGLVPVFYHIASDYFPFGAGLGSFDPVYRAYETAEGLSFNYLNHAHNDYAQLVIEAGLPALIAIVLFLGWWLVAAVRTWRFGRHVSGRLALQGQVALVVTAIFLTHSLADYPLRGAGISVLFALCCARLAQSNLWKPQPAFD